MSKSAIYVTNNNSSSVNSGSTLNLGTIIRRFGCNCNLSGNGIALSGTGYYKIVATFTLAPTTANYTTITAYQDGVAIPGAISGETPTANDAISVTLPFIVRQTCCESNSIITFVVTSGGPVNMINTAVTVEKL